MDQSEEFLEAALVASRTVRRLQREGHSPTEAKRLVIAAIDAEQFELLRQGRRFDEARFIRRLDHLPRP